MNETDIDLSVSVYFVKFFQWITKFPFPLPAPEKSILFSFIFGIFPSNFLFFPGHDPAAAGFLRNAAPILRAFRGTAEIHRQTQNVRSVLFLIAHFVLLWSNTRHSTPSNRPISVSCRFVSACVLAAGAFRWYDIKNCLFICPQTAAEGSPRKRKVSYFADR